MKDINNKEVIIALLCGYLLRGSKLIILGRSNEIKSLKDIVIDTALGSTIFNKTMKTM